MTERKSAIVNVVILAFLFLLLAGIHVFFFERIIPGVYAGKNYLGGKTFNQAVSTLQNQSPAREITLQISGEQVSSIPVDEFEAKYDVEKTVKKAFLVGRSGNTFFDILAVINSITRGKMLGLELVLNEEKLNNILLTITSDLFVDPVYPSLKLLDGDVVVNPGKEGSRPNILKARVEIGQTLAFQRSSEKPIQIEKITVDPRLKPEEEATFKTRAEKLKDKKLNITFEDQSFVYTNESLYSLISPYGAFNAEEIAKAAASISEKIDREPQDAKLHFEGGKVLEFAPAKDGVFLDTQTLAKQIQESLTKLEEANENSVDIQAPVTRTPPEIQTSEVNNLGINELIGKGTSRFKGSISSRVHNISLAASKMNGVLIKPGETFSFNQTLGDVSKFSGYQEAYIIKEGRTILGDGGGVCQVSTTLFRAALNAGLPIIERQAHAYRVGYYEQDSGPGFDATVYDPSPDLKIKNDTPGHILIQTTTNTKNSSLTFELYGTNDGRVASVSKPTVKDPVPPPDDLYQDDPSLPAGQVKQIEHKAWGAKVTFNYLVTRNGEEIYKKTFTSNYRPWQAVYLRGTASQ